MLRYAKTDWDWLAVYIPIDEEFFRAEPPEQACDPIKTDTCGHSLFLIALGVQSVHSQGAL